MRVLIDADACPVVRLAVEICKEKNIEVILYYDDSHITSNDYAKIVLVSQGSDAADYALINDVLKNDLVISQDYGVAAMALAKGVRCMNQNGKEYTPENISNLLEMRALSKKLRKSSKSHIKGPKKRTKEDDFMFIKAFNKIIEEMNSK